MVLNKLPTKHKNPGRFFVPCLIENFSIDGDLCDLGLSVSLMPYSIFKKLMRVKSNQYFCSTSGPLRELPFEYSRGCSYKGK